MDIVLDTNIFVGSNFLLQSKEFDILEDYLKKTDSNFIIPDVILLEVKGKYKERLSERVEQYNKSSKNIDLLKHSGQKHIGQINVDIEKQTKDYITYLKKKLNIRPRQIISYKNEYLPELIKRAVNKSKPFQKEDKGFRDSVIWFTLMDYCEKQESKQICFISNNHNDFGTVGVKNKLHVDLEQECKDRNIKINYFNSIKDFIEEHSIKIDFVTDEWVDKELDENVVSDLIWDKLNDESSYNLQQWVERYHDFERFSEIEISSVNPYDKDDISVYEMIDGTLIVNVIIIAEVEINLLVHVEGDGYYDIRGHRDQQYKNIDCHAYFSLTVKEQKVEDVSMNYWE